MGSIVNNTVTSTFSGKFGDDLVFRQIGTRAFFAKKGVTTKAPTKAQRGNRDLFAIAQNYAAQIVEEPKFSEWYSIVAKVNDLRTAQIAAVKDYLSQPEIDSIDTKAYKGKVGSVIHIKPKMLLKIERINVTLYNGDGALLESGVATRNELNWQYKTTVANTQINESRIVLVAYDRFEKSCRIVRYF